MDEEYLYIEILDKPGLYHHEPVDPVPEGLYCYHLNDPHGYDYPEAISQTVDSDYWGTILLREPLNFSFLEVEGLMFGFYEDSGGNPVLFSAAAYLAGQKPEALEACVDQDEDDLCF